jgi:hypothetical protein
MSGQQKLNRAIREANNRVVAIPTKKRKDYAYDENGQIVRDPKTNEPIIKEVQLYKITKMQ